MPPLYENVDKELAAMIFKARTSGCWFYNVHTEDWFTPEQFENEIKANQLFYGPKDRTLIMQYKILDPKREIRRRIADVNRAGAELQIFTERVLEYFIFIEKDS